MDLSSSGHRLTGLLAAATLLALLVVPAGRATAQDDVDARLGLSAELGLGGTGSPSAWMPLTITISPDVPVQGRLGVVTESEFAEGGRLVQRRDVEVAAGATERLRLVVPPGSGRPQVTLQSGDATTTEVAVADARTTLLVGVLGDADFADRVGAVTDPFTEQVWSTTDVDPAVLDLGPLALEALGSLVADAAQLATLGDAARRTLDAAVNHQGLHLVVTGTTEDPGIGRPPGTVLDGTVEPVAAAWPMVVDVDLVERASDGAAANAASIRSGRGRVTWLTDTVSMEAMRSPRTWGQLWTATPVSSMAAWERQAPVNAWMFRQQGLRLPSSWGMTAFVVTYLVVAGLVALLVVGRLRRRELAWAVLPGVALLLAGVAFVASSGNDVVGGRALVAASWVDGSGVEEVVALGAFEDSPALLPGDGWQVASLTWPGVGVEATGEGVELQGSGEVMGDTSVSWAQRVSPLAAPVEVEAARLADGVHVEVVNRSGVVLSSLRVVTDGRIAGEVEAETLGVGETATAVVAEPAGGDWSPAALEPEPGRFEDMGGGEGRATMSQYAQDLVDANPELVWVLGLAEEVVAAPRGLGDQDPQVVAVAVTPTVDPGAPAPTAWRRWSASDEGGFEDMGGDGGEQWVRLTPPGPASVAGLALDLPSNDGEDCQDWNVFSDDGSSDETRTLCDGDQPECPADANCTQEDGQWFEICGADGSCEYWEPQGGGPSSLAIWDDRTGAFRSWDESVASEVEADPGRVVTPLGDVVVRQCCGLVSRTTIDARTGGT